MCPACLAPLALWAAGVSSVGGKALGACLALCPGPIVFEIHDLNITAGDDVAFCHFLNRAVAQGKTARSKPHGARDRLLSQDKRALAGRA